MIYLNNMSFGYTKQKLLFIGLDLKIEPGNIYGLLGKNGAGKTTLMKIIAGLLFPFNGEVEVAGYEPRHRHPDFLSQLYFVSEEIFTPSLKIKSFKKVYAPFYPNFSESDFYNYLTEFQIDKEAHLTGLSYGQKKKVILSFGLATNTSLLILDEPTNGLDIPSKSQFRRILSSAINDDRTFIISTHQVRDMTNLIDPIIILDESEILLQESLMSISQKLYFGIDHEIEESGDALFAERIAGGYQVVRPNTFGEESEVELESLFNSVVGNKQKIKELFKKEYHDA